MKHYPTGYIRRVAVLALAAVILCGCASSRISTLGDMDNIKVVKETSDEKGNYLIERMELENTSKTAQELAYRVRWLDKEGEPVWADEPWKPVLLHGKQTIRIESVAPTKLAVDYIVEMHAVNN